MQIHEAIAASEYTSAAAYAGNGVDIIVGADGHDGRYGYALYTSMGQQGEDVHSLTLEDIEREYSNLNWWPLRENGEWGEDAEAPTTRDVTINGRTITLRASHYDRGYAPEATDEQGQSVYLGGEDDEDDETPGAALTRGERYLREQAERGNL